MIIYEGIYFKGGVVHGSEVTALISHHSEAPRPPQTPAGSGMFGGLEQGELTPGQRVYRRQSGAGSITHLL